VPLSSVVSEAESALSDLRDILGGVAAQRVVGQVSVDLPPLTHDLDARLRMMGTALRANPTLQTVRTLEGEWRTLGHELPSWSKALSAAAAELDDDVTRLTDMQSRWSETLAASRSQGTPAEVISRVEDVIDGVGQTLQDVEARRARVLKLQSRVAAQTQRVHEAMKTLRRARESALGRLLVADSPPLWRLFQSSAVAPDANLGPAGSAESAAPDGAFTNQLDALDAYAGRHRSRFIVQIAMFVLLAIVLMRGRGPVERWGEKEPSVKAAAPIFRTPIAAALLATAIAGVPLHPSPPTLLSIIFGAVGLIPAVVLLHGLLERELSWVITALAGSYLVDLVRGMLVAMPILYRLVYLGEMAALLGFALWLLVRPPAPLAGRASRLAVKLAVAAFCASFLADLFGFMSLARLIGDTYLSAAYLALVLYASIRIADGLVMFTMHVRPLRLIVAVHNHRDALRVRVHRLMTALAMLIWTLVVLDLVSLRAPLFHVIVAVWRAGVTVGTVHLSVGSLLECFLAIWLAIQISHAAQLLLREDVYPRVDLPRGIPYAISTMLRYGVFVIGFLAALSVLGIDMTRFTILAGAFGVGLGFGLQNIVSNFVSGVILLFERPVNVGDVVSLKAHEGDLERIGMRASVLRTADGSRVIVPNSVLIAETVIDLSSRRTAQPAVSEGRPAEK
jgi:small-conductance mechanosensitive channel